MRIRLALVLLALLALALSSPRPALAGTIDIGGTFGNFTASELGSGTAIFFGDRGFTLNARTVSPDPIGGSFCRGFCRPGDPIGASAGGIGLDWSGSATLDGKTFLVGLINGPAVLNLSFSSGGGMFAPPLNVAPLVALTGPANFSGTFSHVADPGVPAFSDPDSGCPNCPLGSFPNGANIVEELRATATITVELRRVEGPCFDSEEGCWVFNGSATYELTPTPEPATLLLFGTTMAGIGLTRWRRRKLT